jgi:hypothetical protein
MLAQFDIVAMWLVPEAQDENKLVLGSIERAHPAVRLVPDANVARVILLRSPR